MVRKFPTHHLETQLPNILRSRQWCIKVKPMETKYEKRLEAALAKQLKIELAERDWEQKDLAAAADMLPGTLSRYITGERSMPMPVFFKIAAALKLEPKALMERAEARL